MIKTKYSNFSITNKSNKQSKPNPNKIIKPQSIYKYFSFSFFLLPNSIKFLHRLVTKSSRQQTVADVGTAKARAAEILQRWKVAWHCLNRLQRAAAPRTLLSFDGEVGSWRRREWKNAAELMLITERSYPTIRGGHKPTWFVLGKSQKWIRFEFLSKKSFHNGLGMVYPYSWTKFSKFKVICHWKIN